MAKTFVAAVAAAILLSVPSAGNAQKGTATEVPPATLASAPPLVIGSGDLLSVSMFDSPDLSGRFRVNQKGDIDMPLLESIHVAGLTADQAAHLIEARYVKGEILAPEAAKATLFIEEYANQGISVTGEVKNPGVYPAFGVRILSAVITAAGGASQTAASRVIITRREDPGHPVTVPYNPEAAPDIAPETQIFPGDSVFVPRAGMVYVLGNVTRPGGYVLDNHETMTAEKLIALCGGTGRAAALKKAQLVRNLARGRKAMITIPLDQIYKGKSPDVALKDGDILYLPTSKGRQASLQALSSMLGIGTQVAIYRTAY